MSLRRTRSILRKRSPLPSGSSPKKFDVTGMFFRYAVFSKFSSLRQILSSFFERLFLNRSVFKRSDVIGCLLIALLLLAFAVRDVRAQYHIEPEIPVEQQTTDNFINGKLAYTIHRSEGGADPIRPEPGYFDDLVVSVFQDAGLSYIIAEQAPWKRVMEQAMQGDRHVIYPTTRTADRENRFKWVGPISRTIWNLYGYADAKWQNMPFEEILASARIGVLLGSAREPYLRRRGAQQLVLVPREDLLLPMLQADRVDLIAIGGSVLRHYRDIVDPSAQQRDIDGVLPYRSCFLYMAISKAAPVGEIEALQKSLDKNKQTGQFIELREKHGLSSDTDSAFLRAMLNLDNNGVACLDLFGRDD
ncbi:transporter substrate-binding domain-containing protein [Thalassospiraceae bacterium SW-3-3]|nr:transporter substrate-binding domain-containing protein [Thalassospiraceae bacterium SW-3-3]